MILEGADIELANLPALRSA